MVLQFVLLYVHVVMFVYSATGEEYVERGSVYTLWRDSKRRLSYEESDMRFHSDGVNMIITQRQENKIFVLNTQNRNPYKNLDINTSGIRSDQPKYRLEPSSLILMSSPRTNY